MHVCKFMLTSFGETFKVIWLAQMGEFNISKNISACNTNVYFDVVILYI